MPAFQRMMNETISSCEKRKNEYIAFQDSCMELRIVYLISGWHRSSLTSVIVADVLLIPPTIILNFLVISVVKKHHSLQTASNLLLACLAASDFLIGSILIPGIAASLVMVLNCQSICWLYITIYEVGYYLAIVSFLALTLVSLDRYFAISYPYKYQEKTASKNVIIGIITSAWVLPILLIIVSFALGRMRLLSHFFTILAPMSIVLSVATQIRTLKAVSSVRKRDASVSIGAKNSNSNRNRRKSYMREKATRVAAMILIATIACYLPHAVLTTIRALRKDIFAFQGIYDWTKTLVIVNSTLNPIIYCLNLRQMRSKILEMVHSFFPSTQIRDTVDEHRTTKCATVVTTEF